MQINRQTYEEFFLLYADGELNESEKKTVEEFIDRNPDLANEFSLIRETIMLPDESIIFENKEVLFREEDERKVILMRWFRIAAAAAILIAFSIVGWIFLGENKNEKTPIAVVKKPEPVIVKENPQQASEVSENLSEKSNQTTTTKPETSVVSVKHNASKTNNPVSSASEKIKTEPDPAEANTVIYEPVTANSNVPDPVAITSDVVKSDPVTDGIDLPVEPREVARDEEPQPDQTYYAQSINEDSEKSDMIYFANTSLSKKTKLRGVLRKAVRYIDRVTSLQ
jgi:cytoskeletal protein RodZ